jgi:excisionase family DNA binding protein
MARRRHELVSVAEAARQLGVSLSTVWRRIRRGVLPSVRVGGRRRVPLADLGVVPGFTDLRGIPPFTRDNPIFRMIGIGRSGGAGPGSSDKYAILAMEPGRLHEPPPPPYRKRRERQ